MVLCEDIELSLGVDGDLDCVLGGGHQGAVPGAAVEALLAIASQTLRYIFIVMKTIISLNTLAAFTHSILAACSFSALGDLFAAIQVAVTGLGVWGKCQ